LLQDLSPLSELISVGWILKIINNQLLQELLGLQNIDHSSVNDLCIYENPNLSVCAIDFVCEYIFSNGGDIEVYNNAPGCNRSEDLEDACDIIPSVSELKSGIDFLVSPNPCSGFVNLEYTTNNVGILIFDLMDISGVKIKSKTIKHTEPGIHEIEIDLSDLLTGIYFCVLRTNKGIQTKKIIKLN